MCKRCIEDGKYIVLVNGTALGYFTEQDAVDIAKEYAEKGYDNVNVYKKYYTVGIEKPKVNVVKVQ